VSGSFGIEGHPPRLLVKEAPTFLEEIRLVIQTYRDFGELSPAREADIGPRADALLEKFERMGVKTWQT
jgi:hypothetical protein